jgi:phosphate transport system substrate-binding protein
MGVTASPHFGHVSIRGEGVHTVFTSAPHSVNGITGEPLRLSPRLDEQTEELNVRIGIRAAPAVLAVLALGGLVAACGGSEEPSGGGGGNEELSGSIAIDGSSTVFPFGQAAAEQFMGENPGVRISVAQSGTGGGFEKFCAGETQISQASRPIDENDEVPICEENGVAYKEVQVASDGIAIATNKQLNVDCMTTKQLKQLWESGSDVKNLKELDSSFPSQTVSLFGAGTDSGTFDFFTDEINGEEGNTRRDYQPSEDDNVLVQGVAGETGGIGYFGFSYFETNRDKLNAVGVDAGDGCVKPSLETIQSGEYKPLSRPLFMYPSEKALADPATKAFVDYVLANHQQIAEAAQIVPMAPDDAEKSKRALGA